MKTPFGLGALLSLCFAIFAAGPVSSVRASIGGAQPAIGVQLGDPRVISVAPKPEDWGHFQFPGIERLPDGGIVVTWALHDDDIQSYGKPALGAAVSRDGGRTWRPFLRSGEVAGGRSLLANGDQIKVVMPPAIPADAVALPPAAGSTLETYSKKKITFYRIDELPARLQGVYLQRLRKGSATWMPEHAILDDPQALRYSLDGLLPVVWSGDKRVAADGSIIAGIYPGYRLREDGTVDPKSGIFFYRSTDDGHSWKILGRIPYQPDLAADPAGNRRAGFTEPAFAILPGGDFICVMRTTDGNGDGPLYSSRSADRGVTWTKPEVIAPSGADPRLLCLKDGVIVLSSGRPGVQLRFSRDGRKWTQPVEMLSSDKRNPAETVTCGYTDLLSTGPGRFLVAYSDFKFRNKADEVRKAIKVCEVVVTPDR